MMRFKIKKSELHKQKEWKLILRMKGWRPDEMRWAITAALGESKLIGEMALDELDRVNAHLDEMERGQTA